jgi:DNA polymerase III subunit delta
MAAAPGSDGWVPVWLVDGDDPTLIAERLHSLVDDLVGAADRSLVVEDFRGDELDLTAVADACQTPPFLADRRIVIVREIGRFATDEVAPILAYLEFPLGTTALVLGAGGGRIAPKITAAVKAGGQITSTAVNGRDAPAWVRERTRAAPIRLDAAAESLIESHLGEDVSRLTAILDVLVAAHGEGARLGPDDVEPYLGEAGAVAPWDFTDAIDRGDATAALTLLHRMLSAGQRHPLVVASILNRYVVNMLRVDSPSIATEAAAAAALGIAKGRSTFPAKKALTSARRFGSDGISEAVILLADAELDLKGARDWPGELVLEVLVARLCRLARAGSGRPAARSGAAHNPRSGAGRGASRSRP